MWPHSAAEFAHSHHLAWLPFHSTCALDTAKMTARVCERRTRPRRSWRLGGKTSAGQEVYMQYGCLRSSNWESPTRAGGNHILLPPQRSHSESAVPLSLLHMIYALRNGVMPRCGCVQDDAHSARMLARRHGSRRNVLAGMRPAGSICTYFTRVDPKRRSRGTTMRAHA